MKKTVFKIIFLIIIFTAIVLFEARCEEHGEFDFHGIGKSLFHWFIHLSACVLVCETIHSFKHGCKGRCNCDHKKDSKGNFFERID